MSKPLRNHPHGHRGVLFSMCLSLILVVASVSALNLALPDLAVSLGANSTELTWIADAYTVTLAALVLPLGALGGSTRPPARARGGHGRLRPRGAHCGLRHVAVVPDRMPALPWVSGPR